MPEIDVQEQGESAACAAVPDVAWFCLRSQPKHEHIAAGHLRRIEGVEVFNPRMRYTRSTRLGPATVTEAMFPNYVFARFDWRTLLPRVHYAPGVNGIVHFGSKWPTIPDAAIEEIRAQLGDDGVRVVPNEVAPGDTIEVSGGVFHGLHLVVAQAMPGSKRVLVLMDFLGRQTMVEVGVKSIVRQGFDR